SGLIGRKISATFSSMGTPSVFLHAADALHGDLGMLTEGDVLVAISSSGETEFASGRSERSGARHQRKGRSLHVESGADFFDGGGAGYGRRAGGGGGGAAGFSGARFCSAASGRTARQEIAAHRFDDAHGRGYPARAADDENAGRDLRDEPQRAGPHGGDEARRARDGHHHRRRLAARDAAAQAEHSGSRGDRLHDEKTCDAAADGAGRLGAAADGREKNYVRRGGGQRRAARGYCAHSRFVDAAAFLAGGRRISGSPRWAVVTAGTGAEGPPHADSRNQISFTSDEAREEDSRAVDGRRRNDDAGRGVPAIVPGRQRGGNERIQRPRRRGDQAGEHHGNPHRTDHGPGFNSDGAAGARSVDGIRDSGAAEEAGIVQSDFGAGRRDG